MCSAVLSGAFFEDLQPGDRRARALFVDANSLFERVLERATRAVVADRPYTVVGQAAVPALVHGPHGSATVRPRRSFFDVHLARANMGGSLRYARPEDASERLSNEVPRILADVLDLDTEPDWCLLVDRQHTIAGEEAPSAFARVTLSGELEESIPEEAEVVTDRKVSQPLFPLRSNPPFEKVQRKETEGYSEAFVELTTACVPLAEITLPTVSELEQLGDAVGGQRTTDRLGNEWNELQSQAAATAVNEAIRARRTGENVTAAISLDVLLDLLVAFKYGDHVRFDHEDDRTEKISIPYRRTVEVEHLSRSAIPTASKVYVHEGRRAGATELSFDKQRVRNEICGSLQSYGHVTIPIDDRGELPVHYGEIVTFNSDYSEGYARVTPDAEVSFLSTFWAALSVPEVPYITPDVSQRTSDLFRDFSSGWRAMGDGFGLRIEDERRDILRSLQFDGYWVVEGQRYRRKSDFKSDLREVEAVLEDEFECSIERLDFDGTTISRQPIRQRDVVEEWCEEATATPDDRSIIEAAASPRVRSTDIEGIDQPLFARDLGEFVVDTNLVDAEVVSQLVVDGELYDATVILPDVVVEEVHRQADRGRDIGQTGVEELGYLHRLDEAGLIDLDVVRTEREAADNVGVDQTIIEVAQARGVPVCSEDETLLQLAEVYRVTPFKLEQESGQRERLIERVLQKHGELSVAELAKIVAQERSDAAPSRRDVHSELFDAPDHLPDENLGEEVQVREIVDRLEHRNQVYRSGSQIGRVRTVRILPGYDVVAFGELSSLIRENEIRATLDLPAEAYQLNIAVPEFVPQWAAVEDRRPVAAEMERLDELCNSPKLSFEWCPPDLDHAEVLRVDEEYARRAFENTAHVDSSDHDRSLRVRIDSDGEATYDEVDTLLPRR